MVKMLTTIIDGPDTPKPIPNKKIILRRSRDLPFYFIRGELSKSVMTAIEYSTSYYVKDYERTMAYQIGDWNGKENLLYNSKSGVRYFPAGLLESIRGILDDFGVEYTIELPESKPLKRIDVNWVSKKTLYPDQELAVEAGLTEPCGTICMPTGAGKTTVALKILSELKVKTLVLVHRRELVKQWEKAIKLELGYEAGVVGSGVENWKDITIAMIPTLFRRTNLKLDYDLILLDEAHHTPSRSAYKLSMACNAAYRYGLSATPHRPDGADLKLFAAVGGIIYKSSPEELVRLGRLARPEFKFLQTSYVRNIYQGMPFHKVYTLGITANEDRNNRITGMAEKLLSEGYIVYVHVEEVAHGRYLAGHIEGAEFVCGVTKKNDRDSIIGRFSSGKLKCLVSTLLGEGVDIPSITAIIMAGGRKTEIGCIQKIGRALRASPGKEKAIIVDMMDKGIYLSDHWQERYKAYKEYYGVYCPDLTVG